MPLGIIGTCSRKCLPVFATFPARASARPNSRVKALVSGHAGSDLRRPQFTRGIASGPYSEPAEWLRGSPKWGFLIYRCDYRSDKAWKTFIDGWSDRVNTWLLEDPDYKDASLMNTLEFTVKEDRSLLDGASIEQVRTLFSSWTRSEEAMAERQKAPNWVSFPRYDFCVHVDARSLDGCLKYFSLPREEADHLLLGIGDSAKVGEAAYVNFLRTKERYFPDGSGYVEEEDLEEGGIEVEEDVINSIKLHLPYVLPATYVDMFYLTDFDRWLSGFDRGRDGVYVRR
ncbi:Nn.00g066380.m01.CDS01 [Neocucurbitaria sp. VM-36]